MVYGIGCSLGKCLIIYKSTSSDPRRGWGVGRFATTESVGLNGYAASVYDSNLPSNKLFNFNFNMILCNYKFEILIKSKDKIHHLLIYRDTFLDDYFILRTSAAMGISPKRGIRVP